MAEIWHYASGGKQMKPVSAEELKRLAASGLLKPTDLVWKDGMSDWARASTIRDLFSDETPMAASSRAIAAPEEAEAELTSRRRRARDANDEEDDYDERPRRQRRRELAPQQGMGTGLKIGLIVGGSLFGILLIAVIIIAATRPIIPQQVPVFIPPPPGPFPNRPLVTRRGAPIVKGAHAPVYRGPLDIGPEGLLFNEQLAQTDPRDSFLGQPCKVFTIKMKAGKIYTISQDSNQFDSFLRLEDANFSQLAQDDDSGGNLNALLSYRPAQEGVYRVIATTLNGQIGGFTLRIVEN